MRACVPSVVTVVALSQVAHKEMLYDVLCVHMYIAWLVPNSLLHVRTCFGAQLPSLPSLVTSTIDSSPLYSQTSPLCPQGC